MKRHYVPITELDSMNVDFTLKAWPTREYLNLRLEIYQPQCPHSTAEGRPKCAQENTLTHAQ